MDFKCFLAAESVRGNNTPCLYTTNNGEFFEAGRILYMAFKAATGHRFDSPKIGNEIVVVSFRSWIVLDYLTMTVHIF